LNCHRSQLKLNIWNYNEPWLKRRSLIIQTIRQHNPELIGFQEIRRSADQPDADGYYPSDHFGLIADLSLEPQA